MLKPFGQTGPVGSKAVVGIALSERDEDRGGQSADQEESMLGAIPRGIWPETCLGWLASAVGFMVPLPQKGHRVTSIPACLRKSSRSEDREEIVFGGGRSKSSFKTAKSCFLVRLERNP